MDMEVSQHPEVSGGTIFHKLGCVKGHFCNFTELK